MLRVGRWAVVAGAFAGTVGLAATPAVAGAQTLRGLLRQLERATRPTDSTARQDAGNAGAGSSGSAIRVLSVTVEGEDTVSARFRGDTGMTRTKATAACGTQRACAPGWDLRVSQVTVPGQLVPRGRPLHLTIVVENRGRAEAPAAEAALCFSQGHVCDERIDIVPIPALASGERLTVARYVETGGQHRDGVVRVEIDPDRIAGTTNRDNDTGVSGRIRTVSPELQWVAIEVPAKVASGQLLPVRLRVRNKSTVAGSEPVEVQLGYVTTSCVGSVPVGGDSQHRVTLPALAPRQTAVVELQFLTPVKGDACWPNAKVHMAADPDGRQVWGPQHEPREERQFEVVSGGRE